ncbi:protein eva-1-like [Tachypleus tridentatus]|uniref:protein eva-1-like n=1 Tax=Tachypleus tridentatus TaxID=6853 RepID=UPI003FD3A11D
MSELKRFSAREILFTTGKEKCKTGKYIGRNLWILLWTLIASISVTVVSASNIPLVSGTLRNFQVHACDGNDLLIKCWPDTVIAVSFARYGRTVSSHELCPPELHTPSKNNYRGNDTTKCLATQALRAVEAMCRHQRVCKIKTSPESFGEDPCPGIRKYAEVVYKCLPNSFINKIVCENDRLRLQCKKSRRIVIYSASFGGTHHDIHECPQKSGVVARDCQVSYATETVMQNCLGKRRCTVYASIETFGNPSCPPDTRHYLKVVYTCVSKEILRVLDINDNGDSGIDETDDFVEEPEYKAPPEGQDRSRWKEGTPLTKYESDDSKKSDIRQPEVQSDEIIDWEDASNCTVIEGDQKVVGFLTEWIAAYRYLKQNKEKCILYLTLSLGGGLVAFFGVLSVRLYVQKKAERKKASLNINEPLPTSFDEELSDLEHFDTIDRPDHSGVEIVRYCNRSAMKRQDSDTHPRAPMSRNMNNYYYS